MRPAENIPRFLQPVENPKSFIIRVCYPRAGSKIPARFVFCPFFESRGLAYIRAINTLNLLNDSRRLESFAAPRKRPVSGLAFRYETVFAGYGRPCICASQRLFERGGGCRAGRDGVRNVSRRQRARTGKGRKIVLLSESGKAMA